MFELSKWSTQKFNLGEKKLIKKKIKEILLIDPMFHRFPYK